jgi:hypothetical protein
MVDRLLQNRLIPFLLVAAIMEICFMAMVPLSRLRGPPLIPYLTYILTAGIVYILAVRILPQQEPSLRFIWVFAIVFRITILFTSPPSLSDDVYRYIWDGHLVNSGVNPYQHSVDSPLVDAYYIPARELVNNNWMASPYFPAAQVLFWFITRLFPGSPIAYQIAMTLLDLLTGWLIMDMLKRFNLPGQRVLIYLWNPLICMEFAHGAHIDGLMIILVIGTLWLLVVGRGVWLKLASVGSMALAALTKGIPLLLLPLLFKRWGVWRLLFFFLLIIGISLPFSATAGWGLTGPLDGEGYFGAVRIYGEYWNYNSSIYHLLDIIFAGHLVSVALPFEGTPGFSLPLTKVIVGVTMSLIILVVSWRVYRIENRTELRDRERTLSMIRHALILVGAYILLTTTVHPWYLTLVIIFLPFLPSQQESPSASRFIWSWLVLTITIQFSYLSYLDPEVFVEYPLVRWVEYLPFYLLLIWASWPSIYSAFSSKPVMRGA